MLEHFSTDNKHELKVYELNATQIPQFIELLPSLFLDCYVSEEKISEGIKDGITRKDVIETYIPDQPNIMSGEFGEILSFYMIKEEHNQYNPYAPLKWRYKESNNTPSHKTDFVLICNDVANDFIVAAECKAKATKETKNPIQEAIKGMKTDATDRMVKTLIWLKNKAIQVGDKQNLDRLNKLIDPVTNGSYEKRFKAIAIIDKEFFTEPLYAETDINDLNFNYELIAIIVPNLKDKYETVFKKILES